jgi:HEAT repeat protein
MPFVRKPTAISAAASAPVPAAPADPRVIAQTLIDETDIRMRASQFTDLIRLNSPAAVQAILPLLASDDANLRTGAMDALRAMPDIAMPQLPYLLGSADLDVRQFGCELARASTDAATPNLLCDVLIHDGEINVCTAAVDVLAEIGDMTAVPALTQCAARFADQPFIGFAIKVAIDRISKSSNRRD